MTLIYRSDLLICKMAVGVNPVYELLIKLIQEIYKYKRNHHSIRLMLAGSRHETPAAIPRATIRSTGPLTQLGQDYH